MGRWAPDARGRLGQAALDLYLERGFEQTTVADIAARAGLTARTFFRHFADKREVLFAGSESLGVTLREALLATDPDTPPLAAIAAAAGAVAEVIGEDIDFSRRRQAVLAANPGLRERELMKMATWSRMLEEGLRERGVDPLTAALSAQTGVAVFQVGFQQWLDSSGDEPLAGVVADAFSRLRVVTAG